MSVSKRTRIKNGKKVVCYRAQVWVSGVRLASQEFDTKAAAHAWHDTEKENREKGLAGNEQLSRKLTFDECLNRYVNERLPRLELTTQQSRMLRVKHLRDCPLSSLRMEQIKSAAIDSWLNWMMKQSTAKNAGRKSFIFDLRFLSSVLNWYREYSDADYVVPITKRHLEIARYKRVKARRPDYFARPEEVRAWIGWLKDHRRPVYFQLATFMMLTGTRIGEACGLCWSEVNLEQRFARIVRVVAWDQNTKQPRLEERAKTDGSIRLVLLPDVVIEILKVMKSEAKSSSGPIFLGRNEDLLKYNAVQAAFNDGFKALNLPWRSTHICRHTYATLAMMATGEIGSVQAALGHASQKMTEKYAKNVALLRSSTADKTATLLNLDISK
jgi:integrase